MMFSVTTTTQALFKMAISSAGRNSRLNIGLARRGTRCLPCSRCNAKRAPDEIQELRMGHLDRVRSGLVVRVELVVDRLGQLLKHDKQPCTSNSASLHAGTARQQPCSQEQLPHLAQTIACRRHTKRQQTHVNQQPTLLQGDIWMRNIQKCLEGPRRRFTNAMPPHQILKRRSEVLGWASQMSPSSNRSGRSSGQRKTKQLGAKKVATRAVLPSFLDPEQVND